MDTNAIRKELLIKRLSLSKTEIDIKSNQMCLDIINSKEYKSNKVIYLYVPFKNELNTFDLISKALCDDKIVALPVVISNINMVFVRYFEESKLVLNKYKILEPELNEKLIINNPGLFIIPCIGHYQNYRLGYGKNYYNNYLKNRSNDYTIGVLYKGFTLSHPFNTEKDIKLNEIREY